MATLKHQSKMYRTRGGKRFECVSYEGYAEHAIELVAKLKAEGRDAFRLGCFVYAET